MVENYWNFLNFTSTLREILYSFEINFLDSFIINSWTGISGKINFFIIGIEWNLSLRLL